MDVPDSDDEDDRLSGLPATITGSETPGRVPTFASTRRGGISDRLARVEEETEEPMSVLSVEVGTSVSGGGSAPPQLFPPETPLIDSRTRTEVVLSFDGTGDTVNLKVFSRPERGIW